MVANGPHRAHNVCGVLMGSFVITAPADDSLRRDLALLPWRAISEIDKCAAMRENSQRQTNSDAFHGRSANFMGSCATLLPLTGRSACMRR
uniref:Uncharacterized protein n=1 Tax=Globodera rostochiensis TaxID=31243 RepID=A0A914HBG1_GLORO